MPGFFNLVGPRYKCQIIRPFLGYSKRRTWQKLHIAVDEQTGAILSAKLTKNSKIDAHQEDAIAPIIPPRHDAKIKQHKIKIRKHPHYHATRPFEPFDRLDVESGKNKVGITDVPLLKRLWHDRKG